MMKKVYIGIDAHKESNTLALAFSGRGDAQMVGKTSTHLDSFLRMVRKISRKYELAKEDIQFGYEAGPTGFVLARRLIELGYDCLVVAPSLIPTRSGDRVKTDRRDARRLASLLRAGEPDYRVRPVGLDLPHRFYFCLSLASPKKRIK